MDQVHSSLTLLIFCWSNSHKLGRELNSQEPINPFEAPAREAGAAADRSSENPFGDTPAIAADEHRGTPLPWEERMGLVSWWQTAWLILVSPSEAFSRMNPRGQIGRAFLFTMLGTVQARILATVIGLLFVLLTLRGEIAFWTLQGFMTFWLAIGFVTVLVFEPLLIAGVSSLLCVALLHPCVLLWKRSAAFLTTWKIVLYLLALERFSNNFTRALLAFIRSRVDLSNYFAWGLFVAILTFVVHGVLLVYALRYAHQMPRGRAIGAGLTAVVVVVAILAGLGILIFYLGQLG